MKTIEQFKSEMEKKRRVILARIEKDKSLLNRVDMYLADIEHHFKKVQKSHNKYQNKKTKNSQPTTSTKTDDVKKKTSILDSII